MASHASLLTALVLGFCGWALTLAGIALATNQCRTQKAGATAYAAAGGQDIEYDCGMTFSMEWWYIFFQLFVIVLGTLAVVSPVTAAKYKLPITAMFAIGTIMYIYFAERYTKGQYFAYTAKNDASYLHGDKNAHAAKVTATGAIVALVGNFAYLFLFGAESGAAPEATVELAAQPAAKV